MPVLTRELAVSGFSGLMVVLLCRNSQTPAPITNADTINNIAPIMFPKGMAIMSVGKMIVAENISKAALIAIKGGGILFSKLIPFSVSDLTRFYD